MERIISLNTLGSISIINRSRWYAFDIRSARALSDPGISAPCGPWQAGVAPLIQLSGTTKTNPRRLAACLILVCLAGGALLLAWPQDVLGQDQVAGEAKATVESVLSDPAYQTEFPGDPAVMPDSGASADSSPTSPSTPGSEPESADRNLPPPEPPESPEPPSTPNWSLPDLSYLLLAIAIGGFLLLVIYLLMKRTPLPAASTATPPTATRVATIAPTSEPVAPIGPIDDAERLAAAGRYGEAIHVILLRFLGELRHSAQVTMSDASTSREILRSGAVPPTMRGGLATVVGAVELCHFGGRNADEKLFRHCAQAYYETQPGHAAPALSATRP